MKRLLFTAKAAALAAALIAAPAVPPAHAQDVRVVDGEAFWTGNPGPVAPGSFWTSGQYRYDPHHYLDFWGSDPADNHNVVFADHPGAARCVWRKRVVNSEWENLNPYLLVCRR
jgi:hypothetical protein